MKSFSVLIGVLCVSVSMTASANVLNIFTVDLDNNPRPAAVDAEFNANLVRVLNDADQMFSESTNVNLFVVALAGNNASFDGGNILTVPRRMQFSNGYGSEDMQTYAVPQVHMLDVMVHEYGHAIFDKRLVREFPIAAQETAIRLEMSALLVEMARGTTPERRRAINAEYEAKENLLENNIEMRRFATVVASYNEFFSDVVAVYNANSKSAIYSALYYPSMSDEAAAMLAGRSFEVNHTVENWPYTQGHVLLAPLRTVVGSARCWPRNLAEKRTKLRQIEDILITGIRNKLRDRTPISVADNIPLIQAFERTCR